MVEEVFHFLNPEPGQSYLDVTAGMGGHAAAILAATKAPEKAVLVDRDPQAAMILAAKFPRSTVVNQDFLSVSRKLCKSARQFDMILADLGASSVHFDLPGRGFSFRQSGPLDMRMDTEQKLTAQDIVNDWRQKDLVRILKDFGEEKEAEAIAAAIVAGRPISDTVQLAAIVKRVYPRQRRRHPATKTFQALRIAVNDELEQLEQSLPIWLKLLARGGRLTIISFHSLEDRITKRFLAEHSGNRYEADLKLLTKKPIKVSPSEIVINPRARSAKLRAAAKINMERK